MVPWIEKSFQCTLQLKSSLTFKKKSQWTSSRPCKQTQIEKQNTINHPFYKKATLLFYPTENVKLDKYSRLNWNSAFLPHTYFLQSQPAGGVQVHLHYSPKILMANKFLKSWVKKKSKLINIGPEKQWITGLLNYVITQAFFLLYIDTP